MIAPDLPARSTRWLTEVASDLDRLPAGERAELLDGLRAHVREALDAGESEADVLARLGEPAAVAAEALLASPGPALSVPLGPPAPLGYWNSKRIVQLTALVLALLAYLALAFAVPVYSTYSTDSSGSGTSGDQTLVEANGIAVLFVMAIPVVLTAIPLIVRGRAWPTVSLVTGLLVVAFVLIASLSIGWFFVPAMIAAIVAVALPPRAGRSPRA